MTAPKTIAHLLIALAVGGVMFTQSSYSIAASPRHVSGHKQLHSKNLPRTHHRVVHRGTPYYFWGGHFYRQSAGAYISITAPIGAIIPSLPGGFITIGTGPRRYYYYAGAYYRPTTSGYVVIEQPSSSPTVLPAEDSAGRIIVYPAAGQSEEQTGRDRYECHLWASKETDFDPTLSDSDSNLRKDYRRAMNACLEARNYVVK